MQLFSAQLDTGESCVSVTCVGVGVVAGESVLVLHVACFVVDGSVLYVNVF